MNILNYLKIAGVAILAIVGFLFGESRAENKRLEEELKRKDEEEKGDKELQKRIIERDNTSIDVKRDELRERAENKR